MNIKINCSYSKLVQIDKVIPNPRNPNTHPESQIKLLAKVIQAQGWRCPITVSNLSGMVVRGHGRLMAAKLLKCEKVPVDYQDYDSPEMETADLIADNRIAELAEIDNATLKDLLQELDTGELDMELTGFDEKELERMMTQFHVDNEIDFDKKIDYGDDIVQIIVYTPESLAKEIKKKVEDLRTEYPSLVVRIKDGI